MSNASLLVRLSPYLVLALIFLAVAWILYRYLRRIRQGRNDNSAGSFCGSCHGCSISSCAARKNDPEMRKEK